MRSRSNEGRLGHRTIIAVATGIVLIGLIILANRVGAEQTKVPERVHALRLQADELAARQQHSAATPLLDELIKLDQAQPFPPLRNLGRDLIAIASSLVPGEQYQRLEYLFKRGIQVLQSSPDARLGDVVVALHNLSVLYNQMGAYAARNQTMSDIVEIAGNLRQPIDADTASVFLELGRLYSNADQYKPVAILYERLHGYMLERYRDDPTSLGAWLTAYADVLVGDHQFDKAVGLYGQALALLDASPATDAASRIRLLFRMGHTALKGGDLSAAEQALNRARRDAQQAGLGDTLEAAAIDHELAVVYLRQKRREKYPDAEALLRHGLDIEARAGHASMVSFAQGLNQLAVTLDLAGKPEEAERAYGEAIRVFEGLPAAASSAFAECLNDFAALLMRQQRPADAAKHLRRALALSESIPGHAPQEIANAVSNLATAHFKAGNLDEASREYWRAITVRQSSSTSSH